MWSRSQPQVELTRSGGDRVYQWWRVVGGGGEGEGGGGRVRRVYGWRVIPLSAPCRVNTVWRMMRGVSVMEGVVVGGGGGGG